MTIITITALYVLKIKKRNQKKKKEKLIIKILIKFKLKKKMIIGKKLINIFKIIKSK